MKRNALFRVVLWGTVLLVLLAIFFVLLFAREARTPRVETAAAATEATIPLLPSAVESTAGNAVTTDDLNVRSAPDTMAEVVAFAPKGTVLNILRTETIGSIRWGYIGAPIQGWVAMDYVQMLDAGETAEAAIIAPTLADDGQYNGIVTASAVNVRTVPSSEGSMAGTVEQGDPLVISRRETVNGEDWAFISSPLTGWIRMEYVELTADATGQAADVPAGVPQEPEVQGHGVSLDAGSIREIEIEWAVGTIRIEPTEISHIYVKEETTAEEYENMVWNVRDQKLTIQYTENSDHAFGMGLPADTSEKDLIIQVPLDWQCDSLEIDAASASLLVKDLTIREMEFDGASGTCVFENCTVEALDVDTASGDVQFTGSLQQMECDAASANVILKLTGVPKSIDLDTASGDLDVTLPEGAGFTVTLDAMSSEFTSDFDTTQRNGSYVSGNGRCRIDVSAMSGDVTIRKTA